MTPEPKVFTRESPCTKRDIWSCFWSGVRYRRVPVVEAHTIIGLNVPRVMEREGRLVKSTVRGVDYYTLTEEGEEWLLRGIRGYVRNHPSEAAVIGRIPKGE